MNNMESQSQHVAALAQELLDDIELGRMNGQALILKAARLARLTGTEEIKEWLSYELSGYTDKPVALKYMSKTGRWTDFKEKKGYWGSFADQVTTIESWTAELKTIRVPDVSGDYIVIALNKVMDRSRVLSSSIQTLERIRNRVISLLHTWVASVLYEHKFGSAAESIFEKFRDVVDARLAAIGQSVFDKLPAVYDRLREGDSEAISQGMTTCRRIIDAFADALYPATNDTVEIEGNTLSLDASKHQNRINAYIALKCDSKSRRKRLRQTLANLYDRVSSGIHNDLDNTEAQALVLQTYSLLGEIAML